MTSTEDEKTRVADETRERKWELPKRSFGASRFNMILLYENFRWFYSRSIFSFAERGENVDAVWAKRVLFWYTFDIIIGTGNRTSWKREKFTRRKARLVIVWIYYMKTFHDINRRRKNGMGWGEVSYYMKTFDDVISLSQNLLFWKYITY